MKDARHDSPSGAVETLLNLGPLSGALLRRCGILSVGQLRAMGPARAYVRVKREYPGAARSLLWALEGAITDRPWQQVAMPERLGLLRAVQEIEQAEAAAAE